MQHFDHIIVGTGQASGTLLGRLKETGDSIAVIEGGRVGGTCVNTGCTPTKTLAASAKVAHTVRQASAYGFEVNGPRVDYSAVHERMEEIVQGSRQGLTEMIEEHATLFRGWARFEGPRQIRVDDTVLKGGRIYINVGARARPPSFPGIDEVGWLDNDRLLQLETVPEHLIIVGGSYIGLEFGQMFRRFGAEVTILEQAEHVASREDDDVGAAVQEILANDGIEICTGTSDLHVRPAGDGVTVTVKQGGEEREVAGSHLLVAIGRIPNSDRLNLEAAGIETDEKGYIQVDDHCRTNVDGVFALGDVNGRGAFTHTSVNDAEIVISYLFGDGSRKVSDRIPIYAMFIDPPLGRVGLSEHEAVEQGYNVLKATRPMKSISRAKEMGETQGFVKLLVDDDTDLILGASILGVHGDEVVNMFAAYMYSGLPCRQYRQAVLVHPTVSELMPFILDSLEPVEQASEA